ncbi:MAG: membrane protein [Bacteroidia bacterium]|nr:MAG: membrane protein [Bacteroidia bacterium]
MVWDTLIGVVSLVLMEVALGVDNVLFVAILMEKLPPPLQRKIWRFWLVYSPALRLTLLFGLVQLLAASKPLFKVGDHLIGWRELFLVAGGLFLLYKSVMEIHKQLEGKPERHTSLAGTFWSALAQVALVELIFSVDSVLTAVGLARAFWVMATAVALSLVLMLVAGRAIQSFIQMHPTLKMLALAFLLLIGFTLVAEGTGIEIPRGYIYFALFFSIGVEWLNLRAGLRQKA